MVNWNPALSPNAWLRWDVTARLLPRDARDVLEVGCGRGGFAARLARQHRYLGVEPDPSSFVVAQARLADAGEIRNGDLSVVEDGRTFDLVCAFEVIEHIEDDRAEVHAWCERLRAGGWLVISTPAWSHRFSAADELVGHVRRYDPSSLRDLLVAEGLESVSVTRFGAPLAYLLEAVRNVIGSRRLRQIAAESKAVRSAASGRLLQPNDGVVAAATYFGTMPFCALQRLLPGRGPCMIAVARKPD